MGGNGYGRCGQGAWEQRSGVSGGGSRIVAVCVGLGLGLGLGACAGPQWTRPDATPAGIRADMAECRQVADQEVGAEVGADYAGDIVGPGGSGVESGPAAGREDPMLMAERAQTSRRFDRVVASCMKERGYERVKKGKAKPAANTMPPPPR